MTDNNPEPRTDGAPKSERGGLWGLFFGAAGLLLPPYGVVLSLFGVVQGFRARRAARVRRVSAPGALASMVVGLVGIVVSVTLASVLLVFQEEVAEYRDCTTRAQTVSTQNTCDEAWEAQTGLPPVVLGF